jgi:sterol desaturase/sphingolipid hydroxylase (fatty acid hydroxylase superfamily)
MQIIDILQESIFSIPGNFVDANTRLFGLYIVSAVLLVIPLYLLQKRQRSLAAFLSYLFSKRVWLHASAKTDYAMFVVNRLLKAVLWVPIVLTMVPIAIWFSNYLDSTIGILEPISSNPSIIIASFTILLFILDDFSRFVLHLALHKIPFLWDFHKVHHSAKVLTPMTIYRSHPFESYLYACRMAFSQGIAVGIGYYLFGPNLSMFDVLGANLFVFVFNVMGANLRHSHIRWSWGDKIENWFISPAQHQIHHSDKPAHFDRNLGSALAIWDRILGTLIHSSKAKRIRFGLGCDDTGYQSIIGNYSQPFKDNWARIRTIRNPLKQFKKIKALIAK